MNLTYSRSEAKKRPAENFLNKKFSTHIWVQLAVLLYRKW